MIWVHTEGQRCSYSIASKAVMQIMNRNAKFAVSLHTNTNTTMLAFFWGSFFNLKIPFYTWENEQHIWEKYHCSAHNMHEDSMHIFLLEKSVLFYMERVTTSWVPPFFISRDLLSCNWPSNNHDYNNMFTLSKLFQLVLFTKYSK